LIEIDGTTRTPETNRLVLDGTMQRVFVSELEPGDVTALGWTVENTRRVTDNRTLVTTTDGDTYSFGRADWTMLIETRTPCCDPHAARAYSGNGHDAECPEYDGAP